MSIINVLVIAALIATVVVLAMGLRSMAKGGTYDKEHACTWCFQRIMPRLCRP